jgi:hypothetical protein
MILEIVTNKETGKKIQSEFNRIERYNLNTSLVLFDITDYVGYTIVQIVPKSGRTMAGLDIFWLGFFVGFDSLYDLMIKK